MGRGRGLGLGMVLIAGCQVAPAPLPPATAVRSQAAAQATVTGETIVRLRPGVSPQPYAARHGLRWVRHLGLGMHLFHGQAPLGQLTDDADAQWAEPNRRISLPPLQTAPAPAVRSGRSRNGADPLQPAQWGLAMIGADKAWDVTDGSPDVIVAVIDSGIDGSHPELAGQLLPGMEFLDNQVKPGGHVDGYGHGTHVAGVIGAKRGNGIGIAGIAPGCKLLPVRIFNEFGHSTAGASAEAIIWAVDHGAKVINASWGSPMLGDASKAAYDYALSKDVVFVTATGNAGNNEPKWPGAYPGFIGVSASNDIDRWASFSTWGDWVSLAAPGEGILSTFPVAKGNGYRIMQGTSMASPHVAAAAALVRSRFPQLSQAQVKARLEATAVDMWGNGFDPYAGHGRVDIGKAVLAPLP